MPVLSSMWGLLCSAPESEAASSSEGTGRGSFPGFEMVCPGVGNGLMSGTTDGERSEASGGEGTPVDVFLPPVEQPWVVGLHFLSLCCPCHCYVVL